MTEIWSSNDRKAYLRNISKIDEIKEKIRIARIRISRLRNIVNRIEHIYDRRDSGFLSKETKNQMVIGGIRALFTKYERERNFGEAGDLNASDMSFLGQCKNVIFVANSGHIANHGRIIPALDAIIAEEEEKVTQLKNEAMALDGYKHDSKRLGVTSIASVALAGAFLRNLHVQGDLNRQLKECKSGIPTATLEQGAQAPAMPLMVPGGGVLPANPSGAKPNCAGGILEGTSACPNVVPDPDRATPPANLK